MSMYRLQPQIDADLRRSRANPRAVLLVESSITILPQITFSSQFKDYAYMFYLSKNNVPQDSILMLTEFNQEIYSMSFQIQSSLPAQREQMQLHSKILMTKLTRPEEKLKMLLILTLL